MSYIVAMDLLEISTTAPYEEKVLWPLRKRGVLIAAESTFSLV
jgi:hypothetical protein